MFKTQTRTVLKKEQETRAMVAFYTNLEDIKWLLLSLILIVSRLMKLRRQPMRAEKHSELREQIVVTKEQALDKLIQANVEALQKGPEVYDDAAKVIADYAVKEAAMSSWETEAAKKEAEVNDLAHRAAYFRNELDDRELKLTARENASSG